MSMQLKSEVRDGFATHMTSFRRLLLGKSGQRVSLVHHAYRPYFGRTEWLYCLERCRRMYALLHEYWNVDIQ
jgi:hypothetical protein